MKKCLFCGKELKNRQKKYCSHACQKNFEREKYVNEWLSGKKLVLRGKYQLSSTIRQYLLQKANYKCSKCGWGEKNPYSGKYSLEIDHIDGNYKNNSPENLRVLCPNCHSLTKHYRALNKGYGRKERSMLL